MTKVAILVIDMQRDFLAEAPHYSTEQVKSIIPHISKLLHLGRQARVPIIYVVTEFRRDGSDTPKYSFSEPRRLLKERGLREGSDGAKVVGELTPENSDHIVKKKRESAFYQTDLELLLRGLGVETVIVAGFASDGCVKCTVLDASYRDYLAIIPTECVGTISEERNKRALEDIVNYSWGMVMPLQEVIRLIQEETILPQPQTS